MNIYNEQAFTLKNEILSKTERYLNGIMFMKKTSSFERTASISLMEMDTNKTIEWIKKTSTTNEYKIAISAISNDLEKNLRKYLLNYRTPDEALNAFRNDKRLQSELSSYIMSDVMTVGKDDDANDYFQDALISLMPDSQHPKFKSFIEQMINDFYSDPSQIKSTPSDSETVLKNKKLEKSKLIQRKHLLQNKDFASYIRDVVVRDRIGYEKQKSLNLQNDKPVSLDELSNGGKAGERGDSFKDQMPDTNNTDDEQRDNFDTQVDSNISSSRSSVTISFLQLKRKLMDKYEQDKESYEMLKAEKNPDAEAYAEQVSIADRRTIPLIGMLEQIVRGIELLIDPTGPFASKLNPDSRREKVGILTQRYENLLGSFDKIIELQQSANAKIQDVRTRRKYQENRGQKGHYKPKINKYISEEMITDPQGIMDGMNGFHDRIMQGAYYGQRFNGNQPELNAISSGLFKSSLLRGGIETPEDLERIVSKDDEQRSKLSIEALFNNALVKALFRAHDAENIHQTYGLNTMGGDFPKNDLDLIRTSFLNVINSDLLLSKEPYKNKMLAMFRLKQGNTESGKPHAFTDNWLTIGSFIHDATLETLVREKGLNWKTLTPEQKEELKQESNKLLYAQGFRPYPVAKKDASGKLAKNGYPYFKLSPQHKQDFPELIGSAIDKFHAIHNGQSVPQRLTVVDESDPRGTWQTRKKKVVAPPVNQPSTQLQNIQEQDDDDLLDAFASNKNIFTKYYGQK